MPDTRTRPANPGHPDAVAAGCTCSPEANSHGAGFGRSGRAFSIRSNCPVHGLIAGWTARDAWPPPGAPEPEPTYVDPDDALLWLWGEYGGECAHGIGDDRDCPDCPEHMNLIRQRLRHAAD